MRNGAASRRGSINLARATRRAHPGAHSSPIARARFSTKEKDENVLSRVYRFFSFSLLFFSLLLLRILRSVRNPRERRDVCVRAYVRVRYTAAARAFVHIRSHVCVCDERTHVYVREGHVRQRLYSALTTDDFCEKVNRRGETICCYSRFFPSPADPPLPHSISLVAPRAGASVVT